jgi:hypothetical protein
MTVGREVPIPTVAIPSQHDEASVVSAEALSPGKENGGGTGHGHRWLVRSCSGKAGIDPTCTLPIFEGMRAQQRVEVLLGSLRLNLAKDSIAAA